MVPWLPSGGDSPPSSPHTGLPGRPINAFVVLDARLASLSWAFTAEFGVPEGKHEFPFGAFMTEFGELEDRLVFVC